MSDYRSLEHKIRDVMIAEMESRNTAIRRKVENVGRPKDNVKDETSKLAKQGEIKTKIIDEVTGDAGPNQPMDLESKVPDNWEENPEAKRSKTSAKLAKDAMNYDKTAQLFKHFPKLTSEAFKDENGDIKPKKVKDVDSDNDKQEISKSEPQDLDDPKEIKGGKTQVDLHPKTNDAPEDQEREDKVSKKAAKTANKEIGAKGVKEETMTGKLTFGSSQSQINAIVEARKMMMGVCPKCGKSPCQCAGDPKKMKEELVGGQKKLDANHNGKIDAQDFKLLKAKKMKEEVESIDERDMGNKAKKNAAVAAVGAKNKDDHYLDRMNPDVADKIRGREKMSGVDRKQYKEEVEFSEAEIAHINEILKDL